MGWTCSMDRIEWFVCLFLMVSIGPLNHFMYMNTLRVQGCVKTKLLISTLPSNIGNLFHPSIESSTYSVSHLDGWMAVFNTHFPLAWESSVYPSWMNDSYFDIPCDASIPCTMIGTDPTLYVYMDSVTNGIVTYSWILLHIQEWLEVDSSTSQTTLRDRNL